MNARPATAGSCAFELLTFVFGCPGFPPFYVITARPELDRLEAELPPEELAAAREAAHAADFEAVVVTAQQILAGEAPVCSRVEHGTE
jgi:hypothetical protein